MIHLQSWLEPHRRIAGTDITTLDAVQVANLGKSGVSVGYYDTEEAAAKAYDRAAIGLLGRDNGSITTNFPMAHYDQDLVGIISLVTDFVRNFVYFKEML